MYFCPDIIKVQTEVHNPFLAHSITNVHLPKMTSLIEQRQCLEVNLIWRLLENYSSFLTGAWKSPGQSECIRYLILG